MARIKTYDLDESISVKDYLLGNDGDGSAVITKRFGIGDMKTFFQDGFISITESVPGGFVPSITHGGTFAAGDTNSTESSSIKIIEIAKVIGTTHTFTSGDGIIMNLSLNGDGTTTLDFVAYDKRYVLNSLSGTTCTITDTNLIPDVRGTLKDVKLINNRPFFYNSLGQYVVSVNIVLEETINQTYANLDRVVFDDTPARFRVQVRDEVVNDLEILDLFTSTGRAVFDGTSLFNANVTIGDDQPDTNPVDLTVYGAIHLRDEEASLIFGGDIPNVTMQSLGTHLNIGGAGDIIIDYNADRELIFNSRLTIDSDGSGEGLRVTANNGEVTTLGADGTSTVVNAAGISKKDASGVALAQNYEIIAGNTGETTNQTTLTDIKIGNNVYPLPQIVSSVAEVLPGITETLGPTTAAITTGRWFYGIIQSNGAIYESTQTVGAIPIPTNVTTKDLDDTNVPAGVRALFETVYAAVPSGQQLFFVESTYTTPFPAAGTVIPETVNIYQAVSYNDDNHVLSFGHIGTGVFNINTEETVIQSDKVRITAIPDAGITHTNFVKVNPSDGEIAKEILAVSGTSNGARYVANPDVTTPHNTLVGLDITGVDFVQEDLSARSTGTLDNVEWIRYNSPASGGVAIDLSARLSVQTPLVLSQATALVVWRHYILNNIADSASANQSVLLPSSPQKGDVIRITNLNAIGDNGAVVTPTYAWRVNPGTGGRINKSTATITLSHDASFDLIHSGVSTIGWLIKGNK